VRRRGTIQLRAGTGRERRDVNEIVAWVRVQWLGLFYSRRVIDRKWVNLK